MHPKGRRILGRVRVGLFHVPKKLGHGDGQFESVRIQPECLEADSSACELAMPEKKGVIGGTGVECGFSDVLNQCIYYGEIDVRFLVEAARATAVKGIGPEEFFLSEGRVAFEIVFAHVADGDLLLIGDVFKCVNWIENDWT